MSSWLRSSLALLALAAALGAGAAEERDAVVVSAVRNPVDKSYRRMMQGVALFEAQHAHAPAASLRFKLLPRKPGTRMEGIQVAVVGDSFEVPVPVAGDRTFALERDQKALDENASVRPNRRAQTMTWRAEVRTPGLAPDVRRLGDLRLECKVGMQAGLISRYPSLLGWVLGLAGDTPELCEAPDSPYLFFAERPLFSVTLVHGGRRQVLSVGNLYAGIAHGETPREDLPYCDCEALLDRAYSLPLGDSSWPDDTRVELEYMDGAAQTPVPGLSTKAELRALMGEPAALRFDSGFEVWSYAFGPPNPRLRRTEFVVLFSPSGEVLRTRLRPPPPPGPA